MQQHRSNDDNSICSSIDLFADDGICGSMDPLALTISATTLIHSSVTFFAAVRNSIDLSTLTVFAVVLIYPPTAFFAAV